MHEMRQASRRLGIRIGLAVLLAAWGGVALAQPRGQRPDELQEALRLVRPGQSIELRGDYNDEDVKRASRNDPDSVLLSKVDQKLPPQGVYDRANIEQKLQPVPYPYLRETDVLWSKIIWREVDLRQKINYPMYFPTVRMRDRKSLTQTLYDAVQDSEVYAYDPEIALSQPGDEFLLRITPRKARELCGLTPQLKVQENPANPGEYIRTLSVPPEDWRAFSKLWIKEEWYFDTRHSMLQVRILGLCPVRLVLNKDNGTLEPRPAFWVYFPEVRRLLAKVALYNPRNDAQVVSFDDLFFSRRFSSYIIRESNEYNNRQVNEYRNGGISVMLESDRIHTEMFNREHDLWEF